MNYLGVQSSAFFWWFELVLSWGFAPENCLKLPEILKSPRIAWNGPKQISRNYVKRAQLITQIGCVLAHLKLSTVSLPGSIVGDFWPAGVFLQVGRAQHYRQLVCRPELSASFLANLCRCGPNEICCDPNLQQNLLRTENSVSKAERAKPLVALKRCDL